jgi:hypothetical protein
LVEKIHKHFRSQCEKYNNIFKVQGGIKTFFIDGIPKEQPAHTHAALNERRQME